MKDYFGNDLSVGDLVAQAWTGYNALHTAKITSIGKASIVTHVVDEKGKLSSRAVRDPKSCIRVPNQ